MNTTKDLGFFETQLSFVLRVKLCGVAKSVCGVLWNAAGTVGGPGKPVLTGAKCAEKPQAY